MKKKTNRILPVFFICSLLLISISCSYMKTDLGNEDIDVSITQIETSGKKGVILSFNTITSKLEIPSSIQELPVLKIYFNKTTNLSSLSSITFEEPSSVTAIDTFKGASSLTEIILPESLTELPSFQNCKNLTKVKLSTNISEIPDSCFEGCTALVSVSKNVGSGKLEGITAIGKSAFNGCTKLASIALETTSITELMAQTFFNCSALTTVTLPETIQSVHTEAFSSCTALTEVNRFELITSLGKSDTKIFNSCTKLRSITINAQVEEIPADMFNGCKAITTFNIPENVKEIGNSAFAGTSLKELYCYPKVPFIISKTSLPEMELKEEKQKEGTKESTADEETEEDVAVEEEIKYKKVFTLYIPAESESLYKEKWDDLVDWRVIDIKTLPTE